MAVRHLIGSATKFSAYLCGMTRTTKILLGIANVLPLVLVAMFVSSFLMMPHGLDVNPNPDVFIFSLGLSFLSIALASTIGLGLFIYYLVHILKNPRLDANTRLMWVLIVLLAGFVGNIVYWFFQIWREDDDRVDHGYNN
jgi:hypothetical protein